MRLKANWSELPEQVNAPNNFRRAVLGREMGVNLIRWVHPTTLVRHAHNDAEQAVVMVKGSIRLTVGDDEMVLSDGDVVIIPRGVEHSGESIEGEAEFIEVFAPGRAENLPGFLGTFENPGRE
jgi:quercetin dioxygenase-like cupin family protein